MHRHLTERVESVSGLGIVPQLQIGRRGYSFAAVELGIEALLHLLRWTHQARLLLLARDKSCWIAVLLYSAVVDSIVT